MQKKKYWIWKKCCLCVLFQQQQRQQLAHFICLFRSTIEHWSNTMCTPMYSLHGLDFLVRVRCLNSSQQPAADSRQWLWKGYNSTIHSLCCAVFQPAHCAHCRSERYINKWCMHDNVVLGDDIMPMISDMDILCVQNEKLWAKWIA